MDSKQLILKKITISNLGQEEMHSVKGGFDLSDYCNPPDNTDTTNNC